MRKLIVASVLVVSSVIGLGIALPAKAGDTRIFVDLGSVYFSSGQPYYRDTYEPLYVAHYGYGPRYYRYPRAAYGYYPPRAGYYRGGHRGYRDYRHDGYRGGYVRHDGYRDGYGGRDGYRDGHERGHDRNRGDDRRRGHDDDGNRGERGRGHR